MREIEKALQERIRDVERARYKLGDILDSIENVPLEQHPDLEQLKENARNLLRRT